MFTIGTSEPFDRLVAVADTVADACGEHVFVQAGRSTCKLVRAEMVSFMPSEDLRVLVANAHQVVTHAGAGSLLLALGEGKRPVVVPRLRRYGEAIDDHQVDFGRRMAEIGLAHFVDDPERLADVLPLLPESDERPVARTPSVAKAVRDYLLERLGPPSRSS